MQGRRLAIAAIAVFAGLSGAEAGQGPGGGKGAGTGAVDRCGSTVNVVLADGSEHAYEPAGTFLRDMPLRDIDQGENPRPAIKLGDLLALLKADWVKVTDCQDRTQDLPAGLPYEGEVYLVITGRNTLKFVKEVRPGRFVNQIQQVQRLRFHAGAPGRGSKREKQ